MNTTQEAALPEVETSALDAWMKSGAYLPDVLRDFHDQKDVFKVMHDLQQPASPADAISGAYDLSFVTGQCYVIDRFLWFMARRGYTLQRSRARLPFRDLQADVRAATERRDAHDAALLEAHLSAAKVPTTTASPAPDTCRRCSGQMKPGIALGQTFECGDEGTCSPGGPGVVIPCSK